VHQLARADPRRGDADRRAVLDHVVPLLQVAQRHLVPQANRLDSDVPFLGSRVEVHDRARSGGHVSDGDRNVVTSPVCQEVRAARHRSHVLSATVAITPCSCRAVPRADLILPQSRKPGAYGGTRSR